MTDQIFFCLILIIIFILLFITLMKFYTYPREWVEYSLTGDLKYLPNEPGKENESYENGGKLIPSNTVVEQVNKLSKYVLPPHLDYLSNKSIKPYVMYLFEFSHTLTKEDLGLIWQNLPPRTLMDIPEPKLSVSTIDHNLFINDFFGFSVGGEKFNFPKKDIRWMVFKVKQRALKDYTSITPKTEDEPEYRPWDAIVGKDPAANNYGYNWPYDFFSMIELVKMNAGVTLTPGNRPVDTDDEGLRIGEKEPTIDLNRGIPARGPDFPEERIGGTTTTPDPRTGQGSTAPVYTGLTAEAEARLAGQGANVGGFAGGPQNGGYESDRAQDPTNMQQGVDLVINTIQDKNRDV